MQPDTKQRKPAMEVRDLFFSYGKNKVLKGTSFTIEEGRGICGDLRAVRVREIHPVQSDDQESLSA